MAVPGINQLAGGMAMRGEVQAHATRSRVWVGS
ncbi:hypothetical protein DOQ08_03191 [Marinobacter litoralis]|uniref:Uncharacterized protein n=1 Tax=Marinobacter litoralis TaxID=187981 RepID=A0A3M2R8U4_9GAMM|nr:hypothetical protein DOQ08_03191 [Marinobacter litoralis]